MPSIALAVAAGILFAIVRLVKLSLAERIAFAVAGGIVIASFVLWVAAFQQWRAGKPLIPAVARPAAPWGLLDLAITVGLWLTINLTAAVVGQSIVELAPGNDPNSLDPAAQKPLLLIGGVATLAICLLVIAALWIRHRVTLAELGWNSQHLVGDVVLGMKAFAMLAPIVYGLQLLLTQFVESKHPLIELLKKNPDPEFFAVATFAAIIVAPLAEEFLFRVLLQGWLERMFATNREHTDVLVFGGRQQIERQPGTPPNSGGGSQADLPSSPASPTASQQVNPYLSATPTEIGSQETELMGAGGTKPSSEFQPRPTAIIVSSLFFALSHWSHGPDPIPLFVFALGLGYLFQRTHRIVPCIVLHLLLNLCSILALWLFVTA